jgi:hypothetical protein
LNDADAAHERSGGKASHVAHDPAAEGDNDACAVKPRVQELAAQMLDLRQPFVFLTRWHRAHSDAHAGASHSFRRGLGIQRPNVDVGDEGDGSARTQRSKGLRQGVECSLANPDGVGSIAQLDRQLLHPWCALIPPAAP